MHRREQCCSSPLTHPAARSLSAIAELLVLYIDDISEVGELKQQTSHRRSIMTFWRLCCTINITFVTSAVLFLRLPLCRPEKAFWTVIF